MTREAFEQLVRDELAVRDAKRKSRLFDPHVIAEADGTFVAKVAEAAGFKAPAEAAETVTRGRRAAKKNYEAAFPDTGDAGPRR